MACPKDTYSSELGKASKADCSSCPLKTTTNFTTGNTNIDACVCQQKYYVEGVVGVSEVEVVVVVVVVELKDVDVFVVLIRCHINPAAPIVAAVEIHDDMPFVWRKFKNIQYLR